MASEAESGLGEDAAPCAVRTCSRPSEPDRAYCRPHRGVANLIPPVQTGDPPLNPEGVNGYSKLRSLQEALTHHMEVPVDDQGHTRFAEWVNRLGELLQQGDPATTRLLFDRLWPAIQKVELRDERITDKDLAALLTGPDGTYGAGGANGAAPDGSGGEPST